MNASVASQKTKRKLHCKVFESITESKWGMSFKSMCIINFEPQVMLPIQP